MADFEEEILIKDATGRFKILRGGKFYDLEETAPPRAPVLTASKIAEKIIKESKLPLAEPLKKRLEEIINAYLKDVRDKFETKSTLVQPVKAGGMGFSAEQADLAVKLIGKDKVLPEAFREAPPVARAPKETLTAAPQPTLPVVPPARPSVAPPPSMTPGVAEFVFSLADEKEIAAHKQKLPVVLQGLEVVKVAQFVFEIIKASGMEIDPEKQKKLENIILIHLKDIRDGFETRETLLRVTEPAGIVLTLEQTEKLLRMARSKIQDLESKLKEKAEGKIKEITREERAKQEEKWEKAEDEVKKKIDIRWEEITGRPKESVSVEIGSELLSPPLSLRPKLPQPSAPTSPSIVKTAEGAPFAPPPPEILPPRLISPPSEKPAVSKVLPPSPPAISPRPPVSPRLSIPPRQEPLKVKPVLPQAPPSLEAAPAPPSPKELKPLEILKPVTPVFRRPEISSKRPRIEDIKVRPRLVGPVEEIREMTLVDFRQLARDPREAVQKILDKINLLEKESFTKKIAGIKAWHQSAVNKIYLEIVGQTVNEGKSFSEIIKQRAVAGKPVLEEEEFRIIMELNRILRF